jgi:hypothetical protein
MLGATPGGGPARWSVAGLAGWLAGARVLVVGWLWLVWMGLDGLLFESSCWLHVVGSLARGLWVPKRSSSSHIANTLYVEVGKKNQPACFLYLYGMISVYYLTVMYSE